MCDNLHRVSVFSWVTNGQSYFRSLAPLLGIVFIMQGNGMHFTLIGLRGQIEGFSTAELAISTSG